jgi:hypothetical protein
MNYNNAPFTLESTKRAVTPHQQPKNFKAIKHHAELGGVYNWAAGMAVAIAVMDASVLYASCGTARPLLAA